MRKRRWFSSTQNWMNFNSVLGTCCFFFACGFGLLLLYLSGIPKETELHRCHIAPPRARKAASRPLGDPSVALDGFEARPSSLRGGKKNGVSCTKYVSRWITLSSIPPAPNPQMWSSNLQLRGLSYFDGGYPVWRCVKARQKNVEYPSQPFAVFPMLSSEIFRWILAGTEESKCRNSILTNTRTGKHTSKNYVL